MFNYSPLQNNVINQINNFGRLITYRSFDSGEYDPTTGTTVGNGETDYEVKAVVVTIKYEKIDNSAVQRGDRFYLIAASEFTPNEKDSIVDNEERFQIVSIQEIKPGSTVMAYRIQARK